MSEQFREQLSALMDGELPGDQLRFLLKRIDSDTGLARTWARYQYAGSVLRRQTVLPLRTDFADVLLQRIDADSMPTIGARALRWAGGGAIAAAVAVLALVSTRPPVPGPEATIALAATPASAAPAVPAAPALPAARIAVLQPNLDFAQPASFDNVISLPRYRYEFGTVEPQQQMLGPYVLVTVPRAAQASEPQPVTSRQ